MANTCASINVNLADVETAKRATGYENYNNSLDKTAFTLKALDVLMEYLSTIDKITYSEYAEIILRTPTDLTSRLRLVPDERLSARLSHLMAMYTDLAEERPIAGNESYSLVSIEGSNSNLDFDCDLVIIDNLTDTMTFCDYTSDASAENLRSKYLKIMANLATYKLTKHKASVITYYPTRIPVDIETPITTTEPGSDALKYMDEVIRAGPTLRSVLLSKCSEVFSNVNAQLMKLDNTDAPGLYKNESFEADLISDAALMANSQVDSASAEFLKNVHTLNKELFPYSEALEQLASKIYHMRYSTPIMGAKTNEARSLENCLGSLSDYWLCKALRVALQTDQVVALDDADNVTLLSDFPCGQKDNLLSSFSRFKVCVKHRKSHTFTIKFHPDHLDDNLKRFMSNGSESKERKLKDKISNGKAKAPDFESILSKSLLMKKEETNMLLSASAGQPKESIWEKVWKISTMASNDLENMGRSVLSLLEQIIQYMSSLYIGDCIAHYYEVNKSILASLKVSPKENDYYVGINGGFDSITLTKMSSTLDSFSKTNFCVIYKPTRGLTKMKTRFTHTIENNIAVTSFYSTDPNQLSHGLRMPYIYLSLVTWEIENNLKLGSIQNGIFTQVLVDSFFHASVNKDQFAQAAEQVRFFYMSSLGYGGSPADIVDKTTFLKCRHPWEFLYMMRSYKLAASLTILNQSNALALINDKTNNELSVTFPHSNFPSKSFTQTVSSMYLCNVFNKFRAFHEVSEAICYTGIIEELEIYEKRKSEDYYAVSGMSPNMVASRASGIASVTDYIMSDSFVQIETLHCMSLAVNRSKRYSGSISYIMGATNYTTSVSSALITNAYSALSKSPMEACTMRGSMDKGPSSEKNQGLRAASAILEELIRDYEMRPDQVNKSPIGATLLFDRIAEKYYCFSIFNKVLLQYVCKTDPYRYRIVQKDQKGHREISVLNVSFRLGALFVETICREISGCVADIDMVDNPSKDKIVEDEVKKSFKKDKTKAGSYCYDNSDQKRWGPNHNMNFFAAMMFSLLKDDIGLFRLCLKVYDRVFDKRAKFPESLIKMIKQKGMTSSNSKPLDDFFKYASPKIANKIFETVFPMGMCQGIFHSNSSMHHAVMARAIEHAINIEFPYVRIKTFVTSDDALRIIYIPNGMDKIAVVKVIHVIILRIGNLFNIVRSNPKSTFNFRIAELNSNFYKDGALATPSLKQRIAKIDVGSGVNFIEDYLDCLSSAANYLSSGGSYMGAYIMSVLNITLHTEQWLRWEMTKGDNYYKPVEMGGFPVIEPITTIISGGVANMYLRTCNALDTDDYSKLFANSMLATPEQVSLDEFKRQTEDGDSISAKVGGVTIFRGSGPMGVFQLVRTDKKLSQFERRHGISQWKIPESFASLSRNSSNAADFIFNIFRETGLNTAETSLGVNSFYIRMAEPWVSYSRKAFRIAKTSPFAGYLGNKGDYVSHGELLEKFKLDNYAEAVFKFKLIAEQLKEKEEFRVLQTQMRVRLDDALSLFNFLRSQEAESFTSPKNVPTIQNIILRGYTADDAASYHLTILKCLTGDKSKELINNYRRNIEAYDSIKTSIISNTLPVMDAIITADNSVSLYNKFIRRNTKMILPNNVDTLKDLCLEVLKSKFTEGMGIKITGTLRIADERAIPYAHTSRFQELVIKSKEYETALANAILTKDFRPGPYISIDSSRTYIQPTDHFEITNRAIGAKSILVDTSSRDSFTGLIKSWLAADVKVSLNRRTIDALVAGRLTFGHDYYMGDNRFFRYARHKYMIVESRNMKAMHMIQSVAKTISGRAVTSYRHYFIFPDNVDRLSIKVTLTDIGKKEPWANSLKEAIEGNNSSRVSLNKWLSVKSDPVSTASKRNFRQTYTEKDAACVVSLTPGTEFKLTTRDDSLVISLSVGNLLLPVTYLSPLNVESMSIGYELTHEDIVSGIKLYQALSDRTANFSRKIMNRQPEVTKFLNFLMVETTASTTIGKLVKPFKDAKFALVSPIALDVTRTCLLRNEAIGIYYSTTRFSQFLLNLGKRREHHHTYISKKITGERVEFMSDIEEDYEADEDVVGLGAIDPKYIQDIDSDEEEIDHDRLKELLMKPVESWADEVAEDESRKRHERIFESNMVMTIDDVGKVTMEPNEYFEQEIDQNEFSTTREEFNFDDLDDIYDVSSDDDSGDSSPIAESTKVVDNDLVNTMNDMFNNLMGDNSFDDLFDIADDASSTNEMNDIGTAASALDELFSKALSKQYAVIDEPKDKTVKSEITGHTVNATLESSRTLSLYLSEWLSGPGRIKQSQAGSRMMNNVVDIASVYMTTMQLTGIENVNFLPNLIGSETLHLPVELTALAVVADLYH